MQGNSLECGFLDSYDSVTRLVFYLKVLFFMAFASASADVHVHLGTLRGRSNASQLKSQLCRKARFAHYTCHSDVIGSSVFVAASSQMGKSCLSSSIVRGKCLRVPLTSCLCICLFAAGSEHKHLVDRMWWIQDEQRGRASVRFCYTTRRQSYYRIAVFRSL